LDIHVDIPWYTWVLKYCVWYEHAKNPDFFVSEVRRT
jgi:hypothetical protein